LTGSTHDKQSRTLRPQDCPDAPDAAVRIFDSVGISAEFTPQIAGLRHDCKSVRCQPKVPYSFQEIFQYFLLPVDLVLLFQLRKDQLNPEIA